MTTTMEQAELFSSPFAHQLEAIYSQTDLQLVGSIGRRVILSTYGEDNDVFMARRPNGEYRDIDALDHTSSQNFIPESAAAPLKLDLEYTKWVKAEANGTWITFPGDPSIAESVRPEVFTPVERVIGDIACRTYPAATQQKLNRFVFERPKDKQAFREYDSFIASLDDRVDTLNEDKPLPAEFYAPFARLCQAVRENHKGYFWACRAGVVVNSLPPALRATAKRLGSPVRRRYLT